MFEIVDANQVPGTIIKVIGRNRSPVSNAV